MERWLIPVKIKKRSVIIFFAILALAWCFGAYKAFSADSNTVSSTVVTDKSVPTASAPSVVVNNSDVCKSGGSASVQTQVLGIATGITISDENCERIKLARSLYGMGMKVAAVSTLCQDARIFDAMWMSGTPCPFMGKIGEDAQAAWRKNLDTIPQDSNIFKSITLKNNEDKKVVKIITPVKRPDNAEKVKVWATPLGILGLLLLL